MKLLYKWSGNTAPRQADQFVLQFNDDYPDAVSSVRSRDISSSSQSQTHDSTEHFPPRPQAAVRPSTLDSQSWQDAAAESLPSSDASFTSFLSAPGRKRKQDDGEGEGDDVGVSAPETGGVENGSCSIEGQVSKRQKKSRARV